MVSTLRRYIAQLPNVVRPSGPSSYRRAAVGAGQINSPNAQASRPGWGDGANVLAIVDDERNTFAACRLGWRG